MSSSIRNFLSKKLNQYFQYTPSITKISNLQGITPNVSYDHIAFRTLKSNHGIEPIKQELTQYNDFEFGGELFFPTKHLRAEWFKTRDETLPVQRVFVSELEEDKLSDEAQSTILKYTQPENPSVGIILPSYEDYQTLLEESEYAAWTLIHGDLINHTTFSTEDIEELNKTLTQNGFELNTIGGEVKTSGDGLLHQSSVMSSLKECTFEGGLKKSIAGTFVEFIQRDYDKRIRGPREGFEADNAIHIFESTNIVAKHD